MTPEELNQTVEFIIQSQARLAAAQERDREERVHMDRRLAAIIETQTQLLTVQSQRMDDYAKQQRVFQQQFAELMDDLRASREADRIETEESRKQAGRRHDQAQKWHEETVNWLQRILDKITDRLN